MIIIWYHRTQGYIEGGGGAKGDSLTTIVGNKSPECCLVYCCTSSDGGLMSMLLGAQWYSLNQVSNAKFVFVLVQPVGCT